jgi:hypothetical protein
MELKLGRILAWNWKRKGANNRKRGDYLLAPC